MTAKRGMALAAFSIFFLGGALEAFAATSSALREESGQQRGATGAAHGLRDDHRLGRLVDSGASPGSEELQLPNAGR
jgi:hypothetical protein